MEGLNWAEGNEKVDCAIVNMGSGTDCPSRSWCRFHKGNCGAGDVICYAQNTEDRFPNALRSRRENERRIAEAINAGAETVKALAESTVKPIVKWSARRGFRFVRINEAGDLSSQNISFAIALVQEFLRHGLQPFLYTKAIPAVVKAIVKVGAVVMKSEKDFVAFRTEEEIQKSGLPKCPDVGCGGRCLRCCRGEKTAILEHGRRMKA